MTMSRFERWAVWVTTAGTLITGVVYWWMKDVMPSPDPWSVISHPLQPWVLKAHILVAPFMVFSVGLITSRHIWRHYRTGVKKGRRTGILSALAFLVVVLTGYVLQVVTAEALLRVLAWTHLGLGIVYSLAVAAHWPATRTRAAAGTARPGPVRSRPPRGPEMGGMPDHERRRRTGHRRRARQPSGD